MAIVRPDGSDLTLLYEDEACIENPQWSPDGSRLAFGGLFGRVVVAREDIFDDLTTARVTPAIAAVLHPARPNPFNPTTTVFFDLKSNGRVKLDVFDVLDLKAFIGITRLALRQAIREIITKTKQDLPDYWR